MSPQQHLKLLRVVRIVSLIAGVAIMIPYMSVSPDTLGFWEALPFLIGLTVIFLPHVIVSIAVPARCAECGGKAYMETKREVARKASPHHDRIRCFKWKCDSCTKIEMLDANRFDNLLTSLVSTSSDSNNSTGSTE